MSTRTVLVLDHIVDDITVEQSEAASFGWAVRNWSGSDSELQAADAVVHVRTAVDDHLIGLLESCRVIGRYGTGLDSVDLASAKRAGISVVNVRDYCIPELAGLTVGLALTLIHRLGPRHDNRSSQMPWQDYIAHHPKPGAISALVIGYGAIGSSVASSLTALGFPVRVHSRRPVSKSNHETVDLDEGLACADLVFIQRELSAATHGFFDAQLIGLLRLGAIVVNTARKDLMDQAAIAAAVLDGRIGALGVDATLTQDDPLTSVLDHPRVLVTPHIGWYSDRAMNELRRQTISTTIKAYLAEQSPSTEQDV